MASKQISDGSRIAYSCRSYHLVTWQEALDIIIYLYRVIPRVTKLFPLRRQTSFVLTSPRLHVFHFVSFMQGIHLPVVPNERKDYIPARIVYSNRFINMHVYITSLLRTGTQKSNLVSCLFFLFLFFFFVSLFSPPRTHPYVVTCVSRALLSSRSHSLVCSL